MKPLLFTTLLLLCACASPKVAPTRASMTGMIARVPQAPPEGSIASMIKEGMTKLEVTEIAGNPYKIRITGSNLEMRI